MDALDLEIPCVIATAITRLLPMLVVLAICTAGTLALRSSRPQHAGILLRGIAVIAFANLFVAGFEILWILRAFEHLPDLLWFEDYHGYSGNLAAMTVILFAPPVKASLELIVIIALASEAFHRVEEVHR